MKMKFFKSLVLAASIFAIFGLASCSKKKSDSKAQVSDDSASLVSVKLLTDNAGIDDKSFNQSAWRGIDRFYHNNLLKGKRYDFSICKTQDEFQPQLSTASLDGDDLIIASGFFWANPINAVAKENPNQKYMLIDAISDNLPNVTSALFEEETGSYLVGVIAANQARAEGIQNPKFGFIGGIPSGTITRFEVGFVQGIRSVLPNAEIIDYYANSFSAAELGKIQAKNFFDNGVYCIFTAAGATGSGVIAQAKEYKQRGRNVWVIGVDSDQYEDGIYNDKGDSVVLTSMLKNVDNAVYQVLNELQNGKFVSGKREFNLSQDCVGYSISNDKIDPKAIENAENARADIISGKIKVERTYKDALKRGLVPSGLRAMDD